VINEVKKERKVHVSLSEKKVGESVFLWLWHVHKDRQWHADCTRTQHWKQTKCCCFHFQWWLTMLPLILYIYWKTGPHHLCIIIMIHLSIHAHKHRSLGDIFDFISSTLFTHSFSLLPYHCSFFPINLHLF